MRYNLEKLYEDIEVYMYNLYLIRLKETLEMNMTDDNYYTGTSTKPVPPKLTHINIEVLTNGYIVRPSYGPYEESQATYIQSLDELKDLYYG